MRENVIDLRSDTVTLPTPEMREAMAQAIVGDDVYEEDPTINRLQDLAAERMGKQAGLFVPSGTMGNLIAVLVHCGRGDEIILGNLAHTYLFEAGGVSALGGVHPYTLRNYPDGTLDLDEIKGAIRAQDVHFPTSRLVMVENTHNRCGGVALTSEYTRKVADVVHDRGLLLHIDGARIFNAAIALNVDVKELSSPADSVTFCLSKGLCAPVGSVLCGSKEFINRARRIRKQLGGGMRQAGVLAAAGIVALETMVDKLAEDHRRAGSLTIALSGILGLTVEVRDYSTNMVFVQLDKTAPLDATQLTRELLQQGILVGAVGARRIRMVLHYGINDEDVAKVATTMRVVLQG